MKYIVTILMLAVLAAAAPNHKLKKPQFRSVYKKPLHEYTPAKNSRILNGQEAVPHSIPYQAFLEVFGADLYWYCGGSVISENYVLTAGHCGVDAIEAYITLGAHQALEPEDTQLNVLSKEITVHEDYFQNTRYLIYDISVMKLTDPITFNDFIQPSVLPSWSDAENLFVDATATVSGWGYLHGGDNQLADVLNVVNLTIISNRQCEFTFGIIFPHIMCTSGAMDTGICSGDSGGPLVVDGVQVGIVSFGVEDCLLGYPNGYSRVTRFLDWIETNTDVIIKP